jgi:hypothetical protein
MPFYLLYFLLLFLISYLSSSGWKNQVFFSAKKYSWIVTGLSLFMFLLSADQGQLAFEVIKKGSIWTMWQFWSVMIGVFIVPIIFLHLSGKGVWRMIIMTISTLLIAFAVMFFTKADDPAKIESFNNNLGKKGPVL